MNDSGILHEIIDYMPSSVDLAFRTLDGEDMYREFTVPTEESPPYSYLWPYSGYVSGLISKAVLQKTDGPIDAAVSAAQRYERYVDLDAEPPGYNDYPDSSVKHDKFYDDNEWLGMDFVWLYRLTKDPVWLGRAELCWRFAMSGWTDDCLDGGIYWQQGNFESKNTCSNGPAAVLSMMLFEDTHDVHYLETATRIMTWLSCLYDSESGVYFDNIRPDRSIDPARYTYNAGTPIHAAALLFAATGDEAWLSFARRRAIDAVAYFVRETASGPAIPATPWFNAVLYRGLCMLDDIDPEPRRTGIDEFANILITAWQTARSNEGLLPADWTSGGGAVERYSIIDQGAALEIASLACMRNVNGNDAIFERRM